MTQAPGRHALIIEDELISGMGMQELLEPFGFETFAFASTALQALEQARLRRPDLITVDVNLMHGSGPDAVRTITAACGPIPAIYVTGDPQALQGMDDAVVVQKPFGAYDMTVALKRVCGEIGVA